MRSYIVITLLVTILSACSHSTKNDVTVNPREYQIGAYLWLQTSGEYRALTYQADNLSQALIERDLQNKHNKKRAVIFDIDETILDNSFGGAKEIQERAPWKESLFADWVKLQKAVAIPGALDFIKYLAQNQVEIFYISNRKVTMFEDTFANLVAQGFPVKRDNLLLMGEVSSKEIRRQSVQKKHEVVLLVGDNLTDFPGGFEKKSATDRNALVDKMRADFGSRLIVLPNPLYGDWERALPNDRPRQELLKVIP